ncbi:HAD family hydrolase [Acidisphaera sp. S103]|uniref:HAD family hydrolase n=1 Tax=Acidisphaera sp. S103 TaxID=1747223 RepID=UPI00131BC1B0|nr:HAD family hydrolase [Acidisphaera sp. S103]
MQSPDPMPVLIFDLDDTILSCNSFPLWTLFLMTGRLRGVGARRRALLSLRAASLLLRRKIGRLSHDEFQRCLQAAWQAANAGRGPDLASHFEAMLLGRVRANMRPCLDLMVERQLDAVLATAAAADYAEAFGRRLGFRHVLATRSGRSAGEPSNSGTMKRQRVVAFLDDIGWCGRPLILFTDHIDDLPLIQACGVVCWFGSAESLPVVNAMAEDTRFIQCRDMTDEQLLATCNALCGCPPVGALSAITAS